MTTDFSATNRVAIQLPAAIGGDTVYAVRDSREMPHGQWSLVNADGSPVARFAGMASRQLRNVRQWIAAAKAAVASV